MELKIFVTISEDLSSSIGYNTFKSKVHIVVSMKPLNMSVCLSVCLSSYIFKGKMNQFFSITRWSNTVRVIKTNKDELRALGLGWSRPIVFDYFKIFKVKIDS